MSENAVLRVAIIQHPPVFLNLRASLAHAAEGHRVMDTNGHYSRPDVSSLHVDTRPQPGVVFES